MKLSDKRFNDICLFLIVIICLAPAIYGFYYCENHAVNVPYWDQWDTIVPWTIEYHEGAFDLSSMIAQQNDSRPVLTNILMFITSLLTDLSVKDMFYLGYAFYVISIILLFYLIKIDTDFDLTTLLLLIPLAYYVFNPYYMNQFIENLGSLHYPILILTAFISIYLLELSKDSFRYFSASIAMGVMCTCSFAAGLSIWFAGLFQLSIQNMTNKYIKIIIWTFSTAITFYVYFIYLGFAKQGLHSTDAYSSFFEVLRNYPIHKFLCFIGTLGSEVIHQKDLALYFGLIIFIAAISLLYTNRESLELDRFSKWYGLLAFGSLTSFEVALTRSGADSYLGSPDAIFFIPDLRHSLAIFLPIICIYILSILYTKDAFAQKTVDIPNDFHTSFRDRRCLNLFLLGVIFLLISLGSILHVTPGIDGARSIHNQQVANQYYLETYKIQPDKNLVNLYPSASVVRERGQMLEKYQLSVFAKDSMSLNKYHRINGETYSCIDEINQKVINLQTEPIVIDKEKEDEISITGWAVDKYADGPANAVFIVIDSEMNIPSIYGLDRPDVANVYGNKNFRHSGFKASFASSLLEEGSHSVTIKIISNNEVGYYASNQIITFSIK